MRAIVLVASLAASLSCSPVERPVSAKPNPPTTAAAKKPAAKDPAMASNDVKLDWKMARTGKTIHVTYHVDNPTSQRIYVCNNLVVSLKPGQYIKSVNVSVEPTDAPDTALIKVGRPSGDVPVAVSPPCFYVPVEPGKSFDGARDIELPLRTWDAMGREKPLSDKIKKASFLLHAFAGEPPSWRELPGQDGTPIKVPEGFSPLNLKGAVQPLP